MSALNGELKPYFHDFSLREDRDVVRGERVLARAEGVAELAQVDELHELRLTDDQLCAVLDRLVVIRVAERERVARIVRPLDDLEQLAFDEVENAHPWVLRWALIVAGLKKAPSSAAASRRSYIHTQLVPQGFVSCLRR